MAFHFKMPELNLSNVLVALAVAIVAIKFRKEITSALASIPAVGPSVAKFVA